MHAAYRAAGSGSGCSACRCWRWRSGASSTTRGCSSSRTLNGLTLAALYFLVASGFTLVFGLMRNVNLAHGSLYLLGAYVGWVVGETPDSWLRRGRRGLPVRGAGGPRCCRSACSASCTARICARRWSTIALVDHHRRLLLWIWGGEIYQFDPPRWIIGSTAAADRRQVLDLPAGAAGAWPSSSACCCGVPEPHARRHDDPRRRRRPRRCSRPRASTCRCVFAITFAIGAGLAGFAGVVGGTALSIAPGEDTR